MELQTITAPELVSILEKHWLWLIREDGGKRADLSYAFLRTADLSYANLRNADLSNANLRDADLSYADLSNADLRYANLSNANLIWAGQDIRGYLFWAFVGDSGAVEIRAGCRHFVGVNAARLHWTGRHGDDEILRADCLSFVDRIERMAQARGWKLEVSA